MDNSKLIQLIRESINDYIREIDEAGNVAALEAKMGKTKEAIELREKKMNMDGLDEAYHDMLDKGKMKELSNEVKALKKSLAKYEKQLEKLKSKGEKAPKAEKEEEKEIVDEAFSNENNEDELILAYNRSPKVVSWDTIEKKYQESGLTGEEFFADYENEFRNQFEGKPVSKEAYFNFYADRATGGQDDRYAMENWIDLTNQESEKSDDMNIYEVLYKQKLAGIISETEYKAKVEEARFKKGTDIGKKGKGFAKIAKSAAKEYGSEEAGKRVAGAILKKVLKKEKVNESFLHMQKLAGLITESEFKQLTENKTLFTPSEMSDGDQIYVIEYNGEKFEFSYQEYDDAYICLEPWDNNVAQLFKYLKSEGVKAIIDVAPEKTIIIKKDEFEKFI